MKNYEINITGSGTIPEIVNSLREIADSLITAEANGEDLTPDWHEDHILVCEVDELYGNEE